MARKPRPLPMDLQRRPSRHIKLPARYYYSGGRLVLEESEYKVLPSRPKNPAHKTVRTRIDKANISLYLSWLGTSDSVLEEPPKVPLGVGRWAVRVLFPVGKTDIRWVDVAQFSDAVVAFEFAEAIKFYSGTPAEAYDKGVVHAESQLQGQKEPASA